jgi:hypothetical protein
VLSGVLGYGTKPILVVHALSSAKTYRGSDDTSGDTYRFWRLIDFVQALVLPESALTDE